MSQGPVEDLKAGSRHLRGTLREEAGGADPSFSKDAQALIKFHGLYQQKERGAKERPPVLMLRGRIPGGRLAAEQYLAWDALANHYGDASLRLTTRQSIELHGVLKGDLKPALQELARALQTTKGACGDVVRTVTQAPNPWLRPDLAQLDPVVDRLASHFQAVSNAYAEIWLDGEQVNPEQERERVFGAAYLPRKFKMAVTVAGENLVDGYTNDLGLAASFGADGILDGFFVLAGGGLGMTHGDDTTFPRAADLVGWAPAAAALAVAEGVVGIHRDFGNREDRKHARLKYVIAQRGLPWFRAELEGRAGLAFQDRPLPPWRTSPVHGWFDRADGTLALGLCVGSGRVRGALKEAMRTVAERFRPGFQLSPDQDLILLGLAPENREAVAGLFRSAGQPLLPRDPLEARALACVALPLCGLALTEAERSMPDFVGMVRTAMAHHGHAGRPLVFRVTGCPNGCARPYTAELALVGQSASTYKLFAGGDPEGARIGFPVVEKLAVAALPGALDRLFAAWAGSGSPGEPFGDFAARMGGAALSELVNRTA